MGSRNDAVESVVAAAAVASKSGFSASASAKLDVVSSDPPSDDVNMTVVALFWPPDGPEPEGGFGGLGFAGGGSSHSPFQDWEPPIGMHIVCKLAPSGISTALPCLGGLALR